MKHINTFYLYDDRVDLILSDGSVVPIYFNEFSGKAYYRFKINTVSGIKHPGIYIGVDSNGVQYIAHNHYHYGKPILVALEEFTQGQELYPYPEFATNPLLTVVSRALTGIMTGEKYTAFYFNCQAYVNDAISNNRRSPAVENSMKGLLFLGLIALVGIGFSGSRR